MEFHENIVISMYANQFEYMMEKQICEQTWSTQLDRKRYLHIFYTASRYVTDPTLVNNILYVPTGDSRLDTYEKTICAIRYVVEHYDFKNLLKTNCSVYVNTKILDSMLDYKNENDADSIYCLKTHMFNWGIFPRGDFNVYSKQTCLDYVEMYNLTKSLIDVAEDDVYQAVSLQLKYGKSVFKKYKTIPSADQQPYSYQIHKNICATYLNQPDDKSRTCQALYDFHQSVMSERSEFKFTPVFNETSVVNRFKNKYQQALITYGEATNLYESMSDDAIYFNQSIDYKRKLFSVAKPVKYCQHVFIYDKNQTLSEANAMWDKIGFKMKHDCFSKAPETYDGFLLNEHHWTTSWCWKHIIPVLYRQMFGNDIDSENYDLVENFHDRFDLSFHEYKIRYEYEFTDYVNNTSLSGDQRILRNSSAAVPQDITAYHRLFIGAHSVSKIMNKSIDNTDRLLVNCDSMSIPIIPVFANYFKEILTVDNRSDKSFATLIKEFQPTHYLCLMLTTSYYNSNKHIINLK